MNENDLRVQRTRRLLGEALIALVAERDYEAISIGDITQTAQVGYRTFFLSIYGSKCSARFRESATAIFTQSAALKGNAGKLPRLQKWAELHEPGAAE